MLNKFDAATLRLTAWYLGVLMVIALIFSIALYQVSSRELVDSLRQQVGIISRRVEPFVRGKVVDLATFQEEAIRQAEGELRARLLLGNLIILITGGIASYWFARRTLTPIENAVESQGRFTADASHELRTPLTAMRTEIEVALRDKKLSLKDAKELLGSNLEEIGKLETLSESLLRLARYDEGRAATDFTKVPLEPLITKTVSRLQAKAKVHGVTLVTDIAALTIEGDAGSLRELLHILLENAIKYSPDGGKVRLTAAKEGGQAVIAIKDQGIGIKASDVPHIFERFYRADNSRAKTHIDGYGLGLSIAKSIVDMHKGALTVSSTPGKGSTFTISLPISSRSFKS